MTKATEFQTIDERITAFLTERNGRPLGNWEISKHFGLESTESIKVIRRLMRAEIVRPDRSRSQTTYFIPTAAQLEAQQATLDAALSAAADVRKFKPYSVPKAMRDLGVMIQAHREAFPSHFGEAA